MGSQPRMRMLVSLSAVLALFAALGFAVPDTPGHARERAGARSPADEAGCRCETSGSACRSEWGGECCCATKLALKQAKSAHCLSGPAV
jgi:hypothetical protein